MTPNRYVSCFILLVSIKELPLLLSTAGVGGGEGGERERKIKETIHRIVEEICNFGNPRAPPPATDIFGNISATSWLKMIGIRREIDS